MRLKRRELLRLRLHLLSRRRCLRQNLMLRHGVRGGNDGLRRGRRQLWRGQRLRLEARAEEEVHLVADKARLVGEVDAERGLRLLQHGGERDLPGPAGGASEDGLDAAGDLLVGHHGGSVGKTGELKSRKNPASLPRFSSLSLSLSSAPSLCHWRLVSPLCLSLSLSSASPSLLAPQSRLLPYVLLFRANFFGSDENKMREKDKSLSTPPILLRGF
jgi:hypothetical protein